MRMSVVALAMAVLAPAAHAQTFTTAAEVRPILSATKPQWIAVREYDGKDLVYFTNLLAWRCGVTGVVWGINGGPVTTPLVMEPCHEDTAQPNALTMETVLPYAEAPLGSVETVSLIVTYDDGSTDTAEYRRADVLTP